MTRLPDYRYDECGLDNVILQDLPMRTDHAGEETVIIPNVNLLHRLLAGAVASKAGGLMPKELRFLRTEMGLTQAELAVLVGRDVQTIGRWERGENPIEQSAEMVIRIRALEYAEGGRTLTVEELAQRTIKTADQPPIMVDASDPAHYRLAA